MYTSQLPQPGDKVLVLRPEYVAGKIGVVHEKEEVSLGKPSERWLIRIESENLVLSLSREEFKIINQH
ncbi:MAG: hypothetical protein KME64_41685 [Scytonematopsis contorta HA4267-MV1]|nr:hypothetical protein [Scytonematopsis contorta HA4267-MV1]